MSGIHDIKFTPPQGGAARAAFNSFLDPAGGKDGVAPVELEWDKVKNALDQVQAQWLEATGNAMVAAQRLVVAGKAKPEDKVTVAMNVTWASIFNQLASVKNNQPVLPKVTKPEALQVKDAAVILQLYVNALVQKIKEGFDVGEWENVQIRQIQPTPHPSLNGGTAFLSIEATF